MLFEHWIYSTGLAIIAGMVYYRATGRDLMWLIIASAYAPDADMFADQVLSGIGISLLVNGSPISHGDFHNIAIMLIYAGCVALSLHPLGFRLADSFLFAGAGFAAHLLEDALVAAPAYAFLWPLSSSRFGIGMFSYSPDFYGIADREVLLAGVVFLELIFIMRTMYEGRGWVGRSISSAMRPLLFLSRPLVSYLYEERQNS
ncbi:metal-dependent hydrolase [Methanothrix sp.]|uniref:metal-dependent hydrolase n=1 Tax=Methanothrix sp. TaxID=90426 RepID=UPI0034E20D11